MYSLQTDVNSYITHCVTIFLIKWVLQTTVTVPIMWEC